MRFRHLFLVAVFAALVVPVGANASTLLDRNARGITLKVNSKGQAVVSYTARGKKWNVLAWGAVNAIAPSAGSKQVDFKLDYSGGWGTYKKDVWKTVKNSCGTYNGPPLAWRVTSCTAKDGSSWALQSWQRMLPNYGVAPNATQSVWELRLSHWTGPLPELTVNTELGLRQVRPSLRDVPLQGRAGPRLQVDGRRQPARHLRPQPLRRHVQLGLRRRLEAREQLPHAQGHGHLLLRLLPPRQPPDRQGRALPGHDHRPRRDAGRDVAGQRPRGIRSLARPAARRPRSVSSSSSDRLCKAV